MAGEEERGRHELAKIRLGPAYAGNVAPRRANESVPSRDIDLLHHRRLGRHVPRPQSGEGDLKINRAAAPPPG